jgi:hypothetical protein
MSSPHLEAELSTVTRLLVSAERHLVGKHDVLIKANVMYSDRLSGEDCGGNTCRTWLTQTVPAFNLLVTRLTCLASALKEVSIIIPRNTGGTIPTICMDCRSETVLVGRQPSVNSALNR